MDVNIGINAKGAEEAARGMQRLGNATKSMSESSVKSMMALGSSARRLGGDLGTLGGAAKGLSAAFGPLLAVFAAFKGIQGVSNLIANSNEAFLTQEKAARGATESQKQFASQMQVVLGVGDEVSLNLMRQAKALGISDEHLQEATKSAIGLSQATGAGLDESLKKVNQAMRGNANALAEVIPGLANLKTEGEKLAAANELISRGLAEQKAQMEGLQGIQTRASNSLGDLMEVFGQILAPIRAVVSQGIAVFAETMQSVLAPAAALAKEAMSQLPAIFEWVSTSIVGAITVADVAISNFPSIIELAVSTAELYWIQFSETIKHTLTVVIPSYFTWFSNNWVNVLTDIGSFTLTLMQNAMDNMLKIIGMGYTRALNIAGVFVDNWLTVLAGGATAANLLILGEMASFVSEASKIAAQGLTDGFESTTQSLPDVISRQLTEREQQLSEKIGKIGSKLGSEFSTKFSDRMETINEKFANFDLTSKLSQDTKAIASLGQKKEQASELKAVESRLLTRGRTDDPNAKIADNTAATVKELQAMRRLQESEANRQPAGLVIETVGA